MSKDNKAKHMRVRGFLRKVPGQREKIRIKPMLRKRPKR